MNRWEEITDNLSKAFQGSNAPYIDNMCKLSRSGYAADNIGWWVQGIFEILEELINAGYVKNHECLEQAVALMEKIEKEARQ